MIILNEVQQINVLKLKEKIIGMSTSELKSVEEGINIMGYLTLEQFKIEGNTEEYSKAYDNIRILKGIIKERLFNLEKL